MDDLAKFDKTAQDNLNQMKRFYQYMAKSKIKLHGISLSSNISSSSDAKFNPKSTMKIRNKSHANILKAIDSLKIQLKCTIDVISKNVAEKRNSNAIPRDSSISQFINFNEGDDYTTKFSEIATYDTRSMNKKTSKKKDKRKTLNGSDQSIDTIKSSSTFIVQDVKNTATIHKVTGGSKSVGLSSGNNSSSTKNSVIDGNSSKRNSGKISGCTTDNYSTNTDSNSEMKRTNKKSPKDHRGVSISSKKSLNRSASKPHSHTSNQQSPDLKSSNTSKSKKHDSASKSKSSFEIPDQKSKRVSPTPNSPSKDSPNSMAPDIENLSEISDLTDSENGDDHVVTNRDLNQIDPSVMQTIDDILNSDLENPAISIQSDDDDDDAEVMSIITNEADDDSYEDHSIDSNRGHSKTSSISNQKSFTQNNNSTSNFSPATNVIDSTVSSATSLSAKLDQAIGDSRPMNNGHRSTNTSESMGHTRRTNSLDKHVNKRYATIRKALNKNKNIEDIVEIPPDEPEQAESPFLKSKSIFHSDMTLNKIHSPGLLSDNPLKKSSISTSANVIKKDVDTTTISITDSTAPIDHLNETTSTAGVNIRDQMSRKEIISQFYSHERSYIECVYVCNMFRKAIHKTSQSPTTAILNISDYKKLFSGIDQISTFHTVWQPLIENKLKSDSPDILIADFFISLEERFPLYRSMMQNYESMLEILNKNRSNEKFNAMMSKQISIINSSESLSFEAILAKINNRINYYYLSLDEIIKYTGETHVEFQTLLKLKNDFLIFFETIGLNREKKIFNREITQSAAIVELVGEKKKHRLLFLYSDVIVVASENVRKNSITLRWFSSFKKTRIIENYKPKMRLETRSEIEKMKALIGNNRNQLKNEYAQPKRKAQNIDKLERTVSELETQLIFALAVHPLVLNAVGGKSIILLFNTKKEAESWRNSIRSRIAFPLMEEWPITWTEIQLKLDNICKQVDKVNEALADKNNAVYDNAVLAEIFNNSQKDDGLISGALKVKYIVQNGQSTASNSAKTADVSFDIEIDSYNYFFKQYKSKPIKPGETISEIVKMSVEKCLCLKFIFNAGIKAIESHNTFTIDLVKDKIKEKPFLTKRFLVNSNVKIVILIEYSTAIQKFDKIMTPIDVINHFMINVSTITATEYTTIPSVVRICCETIESKGIDIVGIYRISGVSSQINNLKKEWENHLITCVEDLECVDIHAVSGLLKMFLRDLDEKLVPTNCVPSFMEWYRLPINERTHESLMSAAKKLPQANLMVMEYLIKHIIAVSKLADINKMTIPNLSTVFGPNIFSERGFEGSEGVILSVSVFKEILDSYIRSGKFFSD